MRTSIAENRGSVASFICVGLEMLASQEKVSTSGGFVTYVFDGPSTATYHSDLLFSESIMTNPTGDGHSIPETLSQDFNALVQQLAHENSVERRENRRIPRTISLTIQPLDMDFQPEGEQFYAISRDISKTGIGFVNSEPLRHEFVRIGMPEQTDQTMIARVCYNLSIGLEYPLYLVGVNFEN